jgi:hypothetical protein
MEEFMEGGRLSPQRLRTTLNLFIETAHMSRQQAVQVKYIALVIGEAVPLLGRGEWMRSCPVKET